MPCLLKNPDTPALDRIFLPVCETWQMWAVEVLGKESYFSQETRGITAAVRPLCEDGEGCVPGESPKGLVTQLAKTWAVAVLVWETGSLGARSNGAVPGAMA